MKKAGANESDYYGMAFNVFDKCCQTQWRVWKDLSTLQLYLADLWQECMSEQAQRLSQVRTPAEIFTVESKLVTEYAARFNEEACKCLGTLTGAQRDLMNCFSMHEKYKESARSILDEEPAEVRVKKPAASGESPRQSKTMQTEARV